MKKKDLVDLLLDFIETDAIIATMFHYYHVHHHYELQELNEIIQHGVDLKLLCITSLDDTITYSSAAEIEWAPDNVHQEVYFFNNRQHFMSFLFRRDPVIPEEFSRFSD